jgi:hypothetical protein
VENVDGRFDASLHQLRLALALVERFDRRAMDGLVRLSLAVLATTSDSAEADVAFNDALTPCMRTRDWPTCVSPS